jgi:ribosomal-protein-alanine N-acetyltransferase
MALPITTDRLLVRPYVIEDVADIHRVLYGDPEAMRTLGGAVAIEAARRQIEQFIDQHDRLGHSFWAVLDCETGAMTGEAGLVPLGGEGPDIELGYAFGTAFWGRGLATEVGRAILAEAFGPLGLERVVAVTRPDNLPSQRVLAKLGFTPAGRRRAWGEEQLFYVYER